MAAKQPSVETSVAFLGTSKINPYRSGAGSQAPTLYNSQVDPVTYNGFQWSFSAGISWGRFISGEPFIIVPAAGINVTGVSYEGYNLPRLVTGYTGASQQALQEGGVTFYISGSMKNPKPFWEQRDFNFTSNVLGSTIYGDWNYDERLCANSVGRKNEDLKKGSIVAFGASFNNFTFFPVGLSPGDNLVTAKSSFNGDYNFYHRPQGTNKFIRWTNPEMSRMCIEKYGILTALSQGPTYADCYRPPVFWNGASLANRPIFYRQNMVKNTEDYVIDTTDLNNIKGVTLDFTSETVQFEINAWNDFVNNMWISTHIPYYSGVAHQLAVAGYDLYNDDPNTSMSGYMGGGAKVKDKMMHAVYAPWVTPANRRKALDKVTQFSIDCWGIPHAKGIFNGDGGYHAAVAHPWIVWLGWLYNRPDMSKYYLGKQIQERLAPGYTGGYTLSNPVVPLEYMYKMFLTSDYRQRFKVVGANVANNLGFTGWVATNPNIPLYWGLTMPSKATQGACGFGWLYKVTGISCAYSYTASSVEFKSQLMSGSFGTIVCHRDTIFRLNGLGPGSGKSGPATIPLSVSSTGKLNKKAFDTGDDVGGYWAFDDGAMTGLNLKITSGPGAGNTAYRILKGYNHFINRGKIESEDDEDILGENDLGVVKSLQYPTFILDRDFDNGAPNSNSQMMIYTSDPDKIDWGFSAGGWAADLNEKGTTKYGGSQQTLYQQPSYNNIADEAIIKHYSLHNWLGITEDQFLIDYVNGVYFNENLSDATRRQKFAGSAYVGEIFWNQNELGGALVGKFLGISGDQYAPTIIDDLPGQFDNDPEVPLDGIELSFYPEYVPLYQVAGGSGRTYSGWGKVFSEPQTLLKITAVIDDKIFTQINQPGLYALLSNLKVQTGPFLSNNLLVEDSEDEEVYQDRVSFIDFGKQRNSSDLSIVDKDTTFVKKTMNLQSIGETNQSILQAVANQTTFSLPLKGVSLTSEPLVPINLTGDLISSTTSNPLGTPSNPYSLISAKYNFVSDKYVMAGAVGIVPYPYTSTKLASSYEFRTLTRDVNANNYKFSISLTPPSQGGQNGEYINISNMYYCLASPRIPGVAGSWDMAEEYIYENWKKVPNPILSGNMITFTDARIPFGSPAGLCFGIGTTDKLIFFKYMIDRTYANIPDNPVLVKYKAGITLADQVTVTSNSVDEGANHPLFRDYKFEAVKIKNSNGNSGVITYNIAGTSINNTDYRQLSYNHFRIYHNNYFDLESPFGRRALETFVDDDNLGLIPFEYYSNRDSYNVFGSINGKQYYLPKHNSHFYALKDSDPPFGVGFYNYFIHGQTYNLFLPPHPQTLLYVTGAT